MARTPRAYRPVSGGSFGKRQPAFEIADGLLDLHDNRPLRSLVEAHGLDVWTDDGPLACPVIPNGLASVNVAAVHFVGPSDVVGERGKDAVDVSRIEAFIHALYNVYVSAH